MRVPLVKERGHVAPLAAIRSGHRSAGHGHAGCAWACATNSMLFLEIPSLHFPNWQQFGQLAPKHAADIWRGDRGLGKWRAMIPCRGYNCRVGGVTSSSAASPSGLLHRSTKVFNLLFILTYAKLCLKLKIYKIMYFQVTSSLLLFYRSSR